MYNNCIIAHGCLSADCFLEAVSSTDAEENAGREQLSVGLTGRGLQDHLGYLNSLEMKEGGYKLRK